MHCAGIILASNCIVKRMFCLCSRSVTLKLTSWCTVNKYTSRTPNPISVQLAISALPIHLICLSTTASTLVSNHFNVRNVNEGSLSKFICNSTWGKEPHLWSRHVFCLPRKEATFPFGVLSFIIVEKKVRCSLSCHFCEGLPFHTACVC